MDRIFHHDDTMYEAATKVYAKPGDSYVYADEKCTVKLSADQLEDIFVRGMILVDTKVMYKPVSGTLASGVMSITYIKSVAGSGSTVVATPTVLYSSEYEAD